MEEKPKTFDNKCSKCGKIDTFDVDCFEYSEVKELEKQLKEKDALIEKLNKELDKQNDEINDLSDRI